MRTIILASMLLATPAFAQQPPAPEQFIGNLQVGISDALTQIKTAMGQQAQQIAALQQQDAAKDKQIADLTKERDVLKAKAATAPPKPTP